MFKANLRYKKPFIINGYELNDMFAEEQELNQMRVPAEDIADLEDID
jgi:hypothetical protein